PHLPADQAARANAVASDAAASDDSDLRNIAHIGTIVTATSLAIGQRTHASGLDVLAALALGYEVAGRIGGAITPGYSERGFHGCVITVFGGAVAAAKLLRLPPAGIASAVALAATSIGGLYAAANTSVAREYHAGLSAMLGIEAALAAARGFAVDETILEAPRGFFDTFGAGDRASVTEGLGKAWEITSHLAIKLVPGAHPYHAAAEAAAEVARQADVAPDDIDTVLVAARSLGRHLVFHPTDLVGMAHSVPYFVAAGLVDRSFGWEHAAPEKILDPVISSVQDRVRIDPDAERNAAVGRTCGGRVTLTTRSGGTYSSTVLAPRGSSERGIEWSDVDAKYRAVLSSAQVSSSVVETSLELVHHLDQLDDIAGLLPQPI
ncbi:MAG: MmgE/PrpD family protein, partial [Chloroflexi bacterium]|nr:MmgE/PrpD family protein [Chloroflexota bacterium]